VGGRKRVEELADNLAAARFKFLSLYLGR